MTSPQPYFAHPQALVESTSIGARTRVWAFAHILPGAVIGEDCNICDGVFIEDDVIVGDRVTIKCGVQLWNGVRLEDDVFVGPNATFTNDPFPRSREPGALARTVVSQGASIGANATILPGLTVGPRAMVGAGAVVTREVPANAKVVGNPARIIGYVDATVTQDSEPAQSTSQASPPALRVRGGSLHRLPVITDLRGALTFGEIGQHLPFQPVRYYVIFDVPTSEVRGEHAHRRDQQFLVCLRGRCSIVLDDGTVRQEIRLDSPSMGLHVLPLTWLVHFRYSADALLLVLSSGVYDKDEYIRDYEEFRELLAQSG